MKIFTFLLLCSIIIYINALLCYEKTRASSLSDCQKLTVTDGNKCCFFNYSIELDGEPKAESKCIELRKEEYENIDNVKNQFIEEWEIEKEKVKTLEFLCDSTENSDDSNKSETSDDSNKSNTSDNSNKSYCYDKTSASSSDDCKDLKVSEDGNHCCYLYGKAEYEGKTSESERCIEITNEDYDNIDDYIDNAKDSAEKAGGKVKKYEIDCNSSFLTNSLLSIILFLL